jgi:hypothetical protein
VQRRRQRWHAIAQREVAVVPHAVDERIQAREQTDVGRQRDWRSRQSVFEEHAFACESIDVRSPRTSVAVRPDMVGTRRVEGDEQNVGPRVPARSNHDEHEAADNQGGNTGQQGGNAALA